MLDSEGQKLIRQVVLIDEMLLDLDQLLNILQPPRNGKIRIEWHWPSGLKKPRAVVYERKGAQKRGRWTRTVVGTSDLPRRAKTSGLFYENRKVVKALLVQAQVLVADRANLIASVTTLTKSSSFKLKSIEPKANKMREEIMETYRNLDSYVRFDQGSVSDEEDGDVEP